MSASPPPAATAPTAAPSSTSPPPSASASSSTPSTTGSEKNASELKAEDLDLSEQSLDWWLKQDKKDAGELLLKKAMVLMGVSKELGADSERGKALKKEADELLSFANDVQNLPETKQAMEEAHKLLDQLNTKYSAVAVKGQGLADESLKLWSSVSSSKEADALVVQGKNLLADWTKYAQSEEGKGLINKAQSKVQGQSGGLVSMIDEHVLDKDGKPVVQKDKLMNVATQVTEVGKELHKELADDEDVAELLKRAQKDLTNVAVLTQNAAHESILEDKESPLVLANLSEEQKNTLAIMKGERYIRDLKTSGIGQKLLSQGTAYLASGSLSPSALMGQGQSLMSDDKSRQAFINKVKDSALDFLMAYLPTAKVPPIEGEKDGVEYKLENIDLSGFKVHSKDVEVAINEEDGLSIWAINISCAMNGLHFTYKKNTFPKMSGDGKAEAVASGVKFHMRLDLELPDRYKKLISPTAKSPTKGGSPSTSPLPSPAVGGTPPKIPAPGAAAGGSGPSSAAPSPTNNASPPQPATPKKTLIGSNLSKQIGASAAAPPPKPAQPGAGKPPLSVTTAQQKAAAAGGQQKFTFPQGQQQGNPANALSPTAGQASPRSAYTPNGTPIPRENIIRNQKAVARAVAADTPRMILSKTKVAMSEFQLKILSGQFKFVYNFLLKLFSTSVREYLEVQLNEAINEQSSKLLATINELSYEYLPLLEKIMLKADKIVSKKTGQKGIIATLTGAPGEDGAEGGATGEDGAKVEEVADGAEKEKEETSKEESSAASSSSSSAESTATSS